MMNVILREDVPHLGVVGDLVTVKDGYGRNFLIPQLKAELASPRSVKELQHQKRLAAHNREKATVRAETDKTKIEKLVIVITAKTAPAPLNENGEQVEVLLPKLFGAVTNRSLTGILKESGFDVDHRKVTLPAHGRVTTVGKFTCDVRLNGGIVAKLPFWVVPEGSDDVEAEKAKVEAAQQADSEQNERQREEAAEEAAMLKAADKAKADAEKAELDGDAEAPATEETTEEA
jgi:large subunit ribosomal protein L9